METAVSLFLADQSQALAAAHDELYPERVDESVPLSIRLLYPEPDEELRTTMRALWATFPGCPPYGRPGFDPPPHATLARLEGPDARTLDEVARRVEPLFPARFLASEATLMEQYEADRWRVREAFAFAGGA